MVIGKFRQVLLLSSLVCLVSLAATGQSFRVQCPATTSIHPTVLPSGSAEPAFTGPTSTTATYTPVTGGTPLTIPFINNGGAIKCQEVSGGDGYMTEADGNQTFMFAFGPLSGLGLIKQGLPGTVLAADFNVPYADGPNYLNGQPNPYFGTAGATANGGIADPAGKDRKRLVTFVEIDRCATDAIPVVTGCRLGKRALKFKDFGKMAATFCDLTTGRAVRVAARESST